MLEESMPNGARSEELKLSPDVSNTVSDPVGITTVEELKVMIHEALQREHPEWISPTGDSPWLDLYDARLASLLESLPAA